MNVLIIGTRYAPIPGINCGAIEKLVEQFLDRKKNNTINYCIYSGINRINQIDKLKINVLYENTEFRYIDKNKFNFKFLRAIFGFFRRFFKINFKVNEYNYMIVKDLRKKRELENYDLVIVENEVNSIQYFSNKIEGKIISHLHNDYLNIDVKNAKKILLSCNEVWCVSNYIANRVKEIDKNQKNKILVLYNGIDLQKFYKKISIEKKNEIKKKFSIDFDEFVILYVGRLMPEKGVLELINAFKAFNKDNSNSKLIIVGGPKTDTNESEDRYVKLLKKESKELKNKILFTGKIPYQKITDLYDIADVQVVPSICNEAFGLVAAEGMAKGLPMIVSDMGGLPEVLDSNCGFIVKKENIVYEIIEALTKIYENNNLRKSFSENCIRKVKQFDINNYSKHFEDLILRSK